VGSIAVATSKQAEVIAFDAGDLGGVHERIAAVGTCGKFYVFQDLLRPTSLRSKGDALPHLPLAQNAVVAVGYDHTHCLAVPRVNVADIELKGPGSILSADETAGVFSLAATEK
jgi:hypothetical protein